MLEVEVLFAHTPHGIRLIRLYNINLVEIDDKENLQYNGLGKETYMQEKENERCFDSFDYFSR